MRKRLIISGVLLLAILQSSVASAAVVKPPECGVSERIVLENTSDVAQTFTFQRGTHEGLVKLQPGQTVTVDIVECH